MKVDSGGLTKQLLILLLIGSAVIKADKLSLKNFSNQQLWVYVEAKKGPLGLLPDNYSGVVKPGDKFEKSASKILDVWALPFASKESFDKQFKDDSARKKAAEVLDLTQSFGEATSFMSFDIDKEARPLLYYGQFPASRKFTVLEASDIHVSSDGRKDEDLNALCNQMKASISDASKNVAAVLFVGDFAGIGNAVNRDKFIKFFYDPLLESLEKVKGNIFLTPGNHDCYGHGLLGQAPAVEVFIVQRQGGLIYRFKIGGVQFINLGLYPSLTKQQTDKDNEETLTTSEPSLDFLKKVLAKMDKKQPIVLIHHYPIHEGYSDWWSKKEKDAYYDAIKDYNVVAILVGHAHEARLFKFRDKCPVVQCATGHAFTELVFDPADPNKVDITFVQETGERSSPKMRIDKEEKERADLANK